MSQNSRQATRPAQRGASMIELLVSLLIFAFGMLGLVGMQNKTLAYSQLSLYRSQATALSDDILDRMRADRARARNGDWSTGLGDAAASITGTSIARTDLKDWKTQVEALLPSGQASIVIGTGADVGKVTIKLQWYERVGDSPGGAGQTSEFETITTL
jgi:type IV pilus assembly protein PilV